MKVVMQAIFSSICWQIKFSSGAEYWRLGNSDQRSVIIMQATNYCTERKSGRGLYCISIWQDSNYFIEGKGGLFCLNGNLKPPFCLSFVHAATAGADIHKVMHCSYKLVNCVQLASCESPSNSNRTPQSNFKKRDN